MRTLSKSAPFSAVVRCGMPPVLQRTSKTCPGLQKQHSRFQELNFQTWTQKRPSFSISKDSTQLGYRVFIPFPSGKRYRTIKTHTNNQKHTFLPRALVSNTPPPTHTPRLGTSQPNLLPHRGLKNGGGCGARCCYGHRSPARC